MSEPDTAKDEQSELLTAKEARSMTVKFLTLPLHRKIEVARHLGLYDAADWMLRDSEMTKAVFRRAVQEKRVRALYALLAEDADNLKQEKI